MLSVEGINRVYHFVGGNHVKVGVSTQINILNHPPL